MQSRYPQRQLHSIKDAEQEIGAPVFLTKNGRGRYAIVDMQGYERVQATIRLMNELAKGRKSGEEKGWLTIEAMEKHFGITDE